VKRAPGLKWRLTLSLLLVFALGIGTSIVISSNEAYLMGEGIQKRTLQGQATALLSGLSVAPDGSVTITPPPDWETAYTRSNGGFGYTLYDSAKRPIAMSPNLETPLPLFDPDGPTSAERVHIFGPDRRAGLAIAAPDGGVLVVARRDVDIEALADSLMDENYEDYQVLVPFILGSLPLAWLISGWSLRPLARASREAAQIGPANPSARLSTAGMPSEIYPLVVAANGALERLADAYEAERRLTADAAHQLRTPVSVLDLRLQRARAEGRIDWPTITAEMAQLRRLVDQLMKLARRDYSMQEHDAARIPLNLSRIVREAAAMILPMAEHAGRTLAVNAPDDVTMRGRADDLRDMIWNLLDNALVHGEGTVEVTVRAPSNVTAQKILIDVVDQGIGVASELREVVFERFGKAISTSPGAGLGLAIVRQVARSHGGDVQFVVHATCCVRITFPAEIPPSDDSAATERRHLVDAVR
jgi:two-component system sensor histidine kinase TctE